MNRATSCRCGATATASSADARPASGYRAGRRRATLARIDQGGEMAAEPRIAMFIDFENLALGVPAGGKKGTGFKIDLVLKRLLEKGRIVYKRAYCDWSRYRTSAREFHLNGIEMIAGSVVESRHVASSRSMPLALSSAAAPGLRRLRSVSSEERNAAAAGKLYQCAPDTRLTQTIGTSCSSAVHSSMRHHLGRDRTKGTFG